MGAASQQQQRPPSMQRQPPFDDVSRLAAARAILVSPRDVQYIDLYIYFRHESLDWRLAMCYSQRPTASFN